MSEENTADAVIAKELGVALLVSLTHRLGPDFVDYVRAQMRTRAQGIDADAAEIVTNFVNSDDWDSFKAQAAGRR